MHAISKEYFEELRRRVLLLALKRKQELEDRDPNTVRFLLNPVTSNK